MGKRYSLGGGWEKDIPRVVGGKKYSSDSLQELHPGTAKDLFSKLKVNLPTNPGFGLAVGSNSAR